MQQQGLKNPVLPEVEESECGLIHYQQPTSYMPLEWKLSNLIISEHGKQGGMAPAKAKTWSFQAGLQFLVSHVHHLCNYAEWVGARTPIYLATILEYLPAEILEQAPHDNRTCIIPQHLQLAVCNDEELNKLLGSIINAQEGFLPNIQAVLLARQGQVNQNN